MKKPEHIVLCVACVSLVIVAILTTIQPLVGLILLALTLLVLYLLYQNKALFGCNNMQPNCNQQLFSITLEGVEKIALRTFKKLSRELPIEEPQSISDIYYRPPVVVKEGIDIARTAVRLKEGTEAQPEMLPSILKKINMVVYKMTCCNDFIDIAPRGVYENTPLVQAENVFFDDRALIVDWIVVDNQKTLEYMARLENYRKYAHRAVSNPINKESLRKDDDF